MGKIAFICPGQASQYIGMGQDFYHQFPMARDLYEEANEVTGFDLIRISFEGPDEVLKQTQYTQPAIFVLSVIVSRLLIDRGIKPQMIAGHSLGEYSALTIAGALTFNDALILVKARGELMQQAGDEHPGMMAAILGLDEKRVRDICETASQESLVQAANFNSTNQIVISGTNAGVNRAMEFAKVEGAKKVVPLLTSGAFHSPLMTSAQESLREVLESVAINDPKIPLYANVTAEPITAASQIKMALYKQVTHPVLWLQTIQNMVGDGADRFYEVGPQKVLSSLMRRSHRQVKTFAIGTVVELGNI